ncbi:hypothetical protein DL93DRAFT_2173277 [Clavulina sp. PMI_390]|nr:hypothetical protein DL93DRAFT_2173277 [Clavulina sp. PMI_390]
MEFWLAAGKIITIVSLLILSFILTVGPSVGYNGTKLKPIGSHYWRHPGPFAQLKDVEGPLGRFLGFWTVLIQASYAFFGAEVPGVAGGENIPRAVRRIWIKILLFYVLSVVAAGFLVPHNACELYPSGASKCTPYLDNNPLKGYRSLSSPFVIALEKVRWTVAANIVNAAFIASACSAATSDIYISSRYLFFLAECDHAPKIFGFVWRAGPPTPATTHNAPNDGRYELAEAFTLDAIGDSSSESSNALDHSMPIDDAAGFEGRDRSSEHGSPTHLSVPPRHSSRRARASSDSSVEENVKTRVTPARLRRPARRESVSTVSTWIERPEREHVPKSKAVPLVYSGSKLALKRDDLQGTDAKKAIEENRPWWQPMAAIYGLVMCCVVLIFNGWSVFYNSTQWIIATPDCNEFHDDQEPGGISTVAKFITSYVPIPFFALMYLGYKLVHRTQIVRRAKMEFKPDMHPKVDDGYDLDEYFKQKPHPDMSGWERVEFYIGRLWNKV